MNIILYSRLSTRSPVAASGDDEQNWEITATTSPDLHWWNASPESWGWPANRYWNR